MSMGREGKNAKQVREDGQRQTHKTTHGPTNRESRNVTNRAERQTGKGQVKQEMQPRQRETRILLQVVEAASEGQAEMCQHAEKGSGASGIQGRNQDPGYDPKESLPEMTQPSQQAVVAKVQ